MDRSSTQTCSEANRKFAEAEVPDMLQSERYRAAVHEAGHAIMAVACEFKGIRIELSEADNSLGRTFFDDSPVLSEHDRIRHVLVALAGMLTEQLVTGEAPPLDHIWGDFEKATSHAAALPGHTPESLVERAWDYLKHHVPMGLVEEVAMAAMLNDGLSAEEFMEYTDRILPIDLG